MGWFGWMMNPAMLGLGALAVSLPIIIHLLNKRRFKIVTWAAMDFLLDAEKKNRRRVQLQHLILLLLRCLAMLLLGLLLARPLMPSSISRLLSEKQQFERVILLDDSLSQQVLNGNSPAFEVVKNSLQQMLSELAVADDADNWLTLYVTSNPGQPMISNEPIVAGTLPNISDILRGLECSDGAADYPLALEEVQRYVAGQREGVGRVAYFFSDLRERDWMGQESQTESSVAKTLEKIGANLAQGYVVDCGSPADQNVAVIDLQSPDLLVANRIVRFQAEVKNFSQKTLTNFRVLFQVDDQAPQYETVPSLAPGQVATVAFRHLFRPREREARSRELASEGLSPSTDYRIRVEIDRQSLGDEQLQYDQLPHDNLRRLAARVLDFVPVLLVDGDPSPISERSETYFLRYLDVFGTGLRNDVITVTELETISLANYRVMFLCNLDQVSADRIKTIEQWVREGGALVLMPGNQVRAETFNETFAREGQSFSPLRLDAILGDPTTASWVNFEVSPQVHPALRTLLDSDANALGRVNIFSWWTSELVPGLNPAEVTIPLRFSDASNSPAMAERSFAKGKVIAFTIPADGDWTTWPAFTGAYVPVMLDLIDYLVGTDENRGEVTLGSPIEQIVDLSIYDSRVALRDPRDEKVEAVARPLDDNSEAERSTLYRVQFTETERAGFYEMGLTRNSGEVEPVVFAINSPATESRLTRVDPLKLSEEVLAPHFELVDLQGLADRKVSGQQTEFWPQIVWIILLILAVEQFLAYWFGRNQ
jgi:hypothetical protein